MNFPDKKKPMMPTAAIPAKIPIRSGWYSMIYLHFQNQHMNLRCRNVGRGFLKGSLFSVKVVNLTTVYFLFEVKTKHMTGLKTGLSEVECRKEASRAGLARFFELCRAMAFDIACPSHHGLYILGKCPFVMFETVCNKLYLFEGEV